MVVINSGDGIGFGGGIGVGVLQVDVDVFSALSRCRVVSCTYKVPYFRMCAVVSVVVVDSEFREWVGPDHARCKEPWRSVLAEAMRGG